MADDIRAYLEARAAFVAIDDAVQQAVKTVSFVVTRLTSSPRGVYFNGVETSPTYQSEMKPTGGLDGGAWPSADQLQNSLNRWHEARTETQRTWQALPPNLREGLQGPPPRATYL